MARPRSNLSNQFNLFTGEIDNPTEPPAPKTPAPAPSSPPRMSTPVSQIQTQRSEKNLRSLYGLLKSRLGVYYRREDWEKSKELYPQFISTHNALNPDNPITEADIDKYL